jgi:hypothetical protein
MAYQGESPGANHKKQDLNWTRLNDLDMVIEELNSV